MELRAGKRYVVVLIAILWVAGADADVAMNASLPFGRRYRSNDVVPVIISVESQQGFGGELSVSAGLSRSRVVIPVNVGTGVFRYEVLCNTSSDQASDEIVIRLTNRRGKVVKVLRPKIDVFGAYDDGVRLTGWVQGVLQPVDAHCTKDKQGKLSYEQGRLSVSDLNMPQNARRWNQATTLTSFVNNRATPRDLPTDWRLYSALDALMITNTVNYRLSKRQAKAIVQWCRMGGRLVVDRLVLSPATFNTAALSRLLKIPPGAQTEELTHHPFGLGLVTVVGKPLETLMMDKDSMPPFMKQLCEQKILRVGVEKQTVGFWRRDPGRDDAAWAGGMCSWTNLEQIPGPLIILYFLIFVLMVTIGEAILLKRLGRPHLTWVFTPLLVIIFCLGASLVARAMRGVKTRDTVLVFDDYAADGTGRSQSLLCVVPSGSRRYDIAMPGSAAVSVNESSALNVETSANGQSISMSAPVWSHNLFRMCTTAPAPPPFVADFRVGNEKDSIIGKVTNGDGDRLPGRQILCYQGRLYEQTSAGVWTAVKDAARGSLTQRLLDSSAQTLLDGKLMEFGPRVSGFSGSISNFHGLVQPILEEEADCPMIFRNSLLRRKEAGYGLLIGLSAGSTGPNLDARKLTKSLHIVRQVVAVEGGGR